MRTRARSIAGKRKVLDDMGNPESFKRNESASAPPSTPRASLSKKPGLKMLALNRRLWTESGGFSPGGIKDKDYNTPYPDPLPGHKPEEMRYLLLLSFLTLFSNLPSHKGILQRDRE